MANKAQLLRFLDSRVFNPILRAKAGEFKQPDQRALADVQGSTRSEKDRFHHYRSAQEIIDNYKSDLHSETAKRINRELRRLKLPTLPSVEDEFLAATGQPRGRSRGKTRSAGG